MARERAHVVFHLVVWSQAGTIVRILLEGLFGGACEAQGARAAAAASAAAASAASSSAAAAHWAPCVVSSRRALFLDLTPNVVGSFIMGLLSPSSVLHAGLRHRLTAPAPLAMLPRAWSLQGHAPLLVGARTGFCGSLTTFASWMLQVVSMFVAGSWVEALAAVGLGVAVPMVALTVGQQVACALYARHNPSAFVAYDHDGGKGGGGGNGRGSGGGGGGSSRADAGATAAAAAAAAAARARTGGGGLAASQQQPQQHQQSADAATSAAISAPKRGLARRSAEGLPARPVVVEVPVPSVDAAASRSVGSGGGRTGAVVAAAAEAEAEASPRHNDNAAAAAAAALLPPPRRLPSLSSPPAQPPASGPVVVVREVIEDARPSYTGAWLAADALTAALGLALTALAAWQVALAARSGMPDDGRRAFVPTYGWIAVLLSPAGSFTRYRLSRLNDGRGVWSWRRWWWQRQRRWPRRRQQRPRLPRGVSSNGGGEDNLAPPPPPPPPPPRVLRWFPWGTFAANVLACVLDFACKAAELAMPGGGWEHAALAGVVSGVGGTLSTVSTFVVELQRLMLGYPVDRRGWAYMLWSVGVSIALGIAIYGGAVWSGAV